MLGSSLMAREAKTMTLTQWGELDEDDEGELVDGVLEEEEMPTWLHEMIVKWFHRHLDAWALRHDAEVAGSELKIAVGPRSGRKPDLSGFARADVPPPTTTVVRSKPLLVLEVLSPRPRDQRRDRVDKLRDYAHAGARHHWLVDPQLRTIEMLRLKDKRYVVATVATAGRVKPRDSRASRST
jgi:Uma2 family endonuclease